MVIESDAQWDEVLESFPDHNVFQSSAWAFHKAAHGWTPRRAVITEKGTPVAAAQFLLKRRAGMLVLWSRGGPVGSAAHWNEDLRRQLAKGLGAGLPYLRFCSYQEQKPAALSLITGNGWARPAQALNRNLTFVMDLGRPEKELLAGLSENWSHNMRRGLRRCGEPRVWENPRPEELLSVYRSMESYKGMKPQYEAPELSSLLKHLGTYLVLLRTDDAAGTPLALRACAVQGDKAWDLLAASSEAGRKCYASYALLWKLLEHCRGLGVKSYDFGGADPDKAKGVYDFKKGTGARPVEYLGEFDWSTPALLRRPAGFAIGLWVGQAL